MKTASAVCCSLSFVLADATLTTVLYVRGSDLAAFARDAYDFDVSRSVLDLWGLLLVRAALLMGVSLGVSRNRAEGPGRVSALGPIWDLLSLAVAGYDVVKLLVFSEQGPSMYDPWFLCLSGWTCLSAAGTASAWRLLAGSHDVVAGDGGGGGGQEEESESLLGQSAAGVEVVEGATGEGGEEIRRRGAKDGPRSRATVGQLLSYCRKDAGLLTVATLFLLLSAVCEAFIPYYTGLAIDGIVIHKSMEHFTRPMVTLTVLALVSSIAIGVRGGVFTITFARLNIRLRNLLFRSLMRQEIGFFDTNHTGDITSRLTSDTTQKLTQEVQDSLAQANKLAEETVSAMRTVRSFASEEREADSYHAQLLDMFQLNKKQALAYACYMWSSYVSELALQVGILYYGGHLVVSGQMSGGTLISFFIYELELGECLDSIASVYSGLMQGVGAAEKVFEYIDRTPKLARNGHEAPDACKGLVEFRNVTFAYPTRPGTEILQDVSFSARPGQVTALVGPSGSGKSSCISLLESFYAPLQGQVLLDGRPVHTYQHSYLHSQVALVGQEPVLFARSVQKNISYGLPDTPMDAVMQAAVQANAHDFICSLPQGYNTGVGEKGTQLSGGQKQRVAIARALVRNPRVLVLDEATSALDAESEHLVQQALSDVMRDSTVLVIAHRLSTVERADSIVVIDRGRVAEQGPHAELMARGGLYCKLVQRQVLGAETLNSTPWEPARQPEGWRSRGASESDDGPRY